MIIMHIISMLSIVDAIGSEIYALFGFYEQEGECEWKIVNRGCGLSQGEAYRSRSKGCSSEIN
jgi:hypothetical protein